MLEKIVEICRKWFGKKHVSVVENVEVETTVKTEAKNRKRTLLDNLEGFLFARYDFRQQRYAFPHVPIHRGRR